MKSGWIDFGLVRDFLAEQTNAYRICTKPEAWAERFGNDALVSFKTERNRDAIIDELQLIYNKTRQAAITKELSEIVAGAAAV